MFGFRTLTVFLTLPGILRFGKNRQEIFLSNIFSSTPLLFGCLVGKLCTQNLLLDDDLYFYAVFLHKSVQAIKLNILH